MFQPIVCIPLTDGVKVLHRTSPNYLIAKPEFIQRLQALPLNAEVPKWFTEVVATKWGIDLTNTTICDSILIRNQPQYTYGLASWELNLLCNYNCEHCYLGERPNSSLDMESRRRILDMMIELGVIRLQLTGGEPLIDRHFVSTYTEAYDRGIVITISTNGSRLANKSILSTIIQRPPLRIVVSLYGATAQSYESLTRTPPRTFDRFVKGLNAVKKAGIALRINSIVTRHNEHEREDMQALARVFTQEAFVYDSMSATIHGDAGPLASQAQKVNFRRSKPPFAGCGAGTQSFHLDPLGRASMCKVGRNPFIQLDQEGPGAMSRLRASAELKLIRSGACAGCGVQNSCTTCPVIVSNYRNAGADKKFFCQHS